MQINAKKLVMLRKREGLTADQLAERAKIGRATITRIENGHTTSSSSNTVQKLATALKVSTDELSSAPSSEGRSGLLSNRHTLSVEISTAAQNALALMAIRYGEKRETIVALAPLLFDLVAKESLIERRKLLNELRARRAEIGAMASNFPHMSGRYTCDWNAEEFDDREERSINNADIRAEEVHRNDDFDDDAFYPNEFELESHNPFVQHIKRRLEYAAVDGHERVELEAITRWFGPIYELGLPEAAKLAGEDDDLAHDIVAGLLPIASVPKELWKEERLADRQDWMRKFVAEESERLLGSLSDLGL